MSIWLSFEHNLKGKEINVCVKRSTSSILGLSKHKTSFLARGITWLLRLLNLRAIGEIADGLFVVSLDSISCLDSILPTLKVTQSVASQP